jgi:DNA-binding CsgD family transcriptional regulator
MVSPIMRHEIEERLLQEMEAARMEYNRVSQKFLLFMTENANFMAENASEPFALTNERRFSQFMALRHAAVDRYCAALHLFQLSVSTNHATGIEFGTLPANNEYNLTNREWDVLRLLIAGRSTKQVAGDIGLSFNTVASYRHHIMTKMAVHETASMVRKALLAGLDRENGGGHAHGGPQRISRNAVKGGPAEAAR